MLGDKIALAVKRALFVKVFVLNQFHVYTCCLCYLVNNARKPMARLSGSC
jgi:hypothetical protein